MGREKAKGSEMLYYSKPHLVCSEQCNANTCSTSTTYLMNSWYSALTVLSVHRVCVL